MLNYKDRVLIISGCYSSWFFGGNWIWNDSCPLSPLHKCPNSDLSGGSCSWAMSIPEESKLEPQNSAQSTQPWIIVLPHPWAAPVPNLLWHRHSCPLSSWFARSPCELRALRAGRRKFISNVGDESGEVWGLRDGWKPKKIPADAGGEAVISVTPGRCWGWGAQHTPAKATKILISAQKNINAKEWCEIGVLLGSSLSSGLYTRTSSKHFVLSSAPVEERQL